MDPLASWLHGRPATTRRVYAAVFYTAVFSDLRASAAVPRYAITVAEAQTGANGLVAPGLEPASQARYLG